MKPANTSEAAAMADNHLYESGNQGYRSGGRGTDGGGRDHAHKRHDGPSQQKGDRQGKPDAGSHSTTTSGSRLKDQGYQTGMNKDNLDASSVATMGT